MIRIHSNSAYFYNKLNFGHFDTKEYCVHISSQKQVGIWVGIDKRSRIAYKHGDGVTLALPLEPNILSV